MLRGCLRAPVSHAEFPWTTVSNGPNYMDAHFATIVAELSPGIEV